MTSTNKVQFKFYGKNVNDGKYADYVYIGSMWLNADTHRQALISAGESIGGPVYGPMIAMTQETVAIIVLKV